MPQRGSRAAIRLAALACAAAAPARAQLVDDARWLELHPSLRVTGLQDSNIYLSGGGAQPTPVRSAFITNLEAALGGTARLAPRHSLDLEFGLQALSYTADPQVNDAVNAGGKAHYAYQGPRGLSAQADLSALTTNVPATTEQVQRTHRTSAGAGLQAEYGPAVFFAGLEASQRRDRYSDPSYARELDLDDTRLGGRFGVRFGDQGRGRLYAILRRDSIRFTDGRDTDSDADQYGLGLQAKLDARLTAKLEGALERTRFAAVQEPGQPLDVDQGVFEASLAWSPRRRTDVSVGLSRSMQISSLSGSRFYLANVADLAASHLFPWGLKTTLGGGGEGDEYTEGSPSMPPRTDLVWVVHASLEYPLGRTVFLGLNFLNRRRISHAVSALDFSDQQAGMFLQYKY